MALEVLTFLFLHKLLNIESYMLVSLSFHVLLIGLKRIYRIFEYSFEMIEQIFVRLETNIRMETNICLLLMCKLHDFCIYRRDRKYIFLPKLLIIS